MRWFKHLTNSWEDEKLSELTYEYGLELYGFWWRILEIIAKQMDDTDKTKCRYSDKVWAVFTGLPVKKMRKFAKILEEKKLIILENSETNLTISVPNLLKFKDEYSSRKPKKSG